jgi:hypothetical protein
MSDGTSTPPALPVFVESDVKYLRELADKMERIFYFVNPNWVRSLADRVEGTLAKLKEATGGK